MSLSDVNRTSPLFPQKLAHGAWWQQGRTTLCVCVCVCVAVFSCRCRSSASRGRCSAGLWEISLRSSPQQQSVDKTSKFSLVFKIKCYLGSRIGRKTWMKVWLLKPDIAFDLGQLKSSRRTFLRSRRKSLRVKLLRFFWETTWWILTEVSVPGRNDGELWDSCRPTRVMWLWGIVKSSCLFPRLSAAWVCVCVCVTQLFLQQVGHRKQLSLSDHSCVIEEESPDWTFSNVT